MSEAKWQILCTECAQTRAEESEEVEVCLAMMGPISEEGEESVLVCVPWARRVKWINSSPYLCDGCGQKVSVAASSNWFVERNKQEQAS